MARPRTRSDDEILAAAARVAAARGPDGLTLHAVSAEAGLGAATLVQRFGGKRGLLLAMARRAAATVGDELARARSRAADGPVAALVAALGDAGLWRDAHDPVRMANHVGMLHRDLVDPAMRAAAAAHAAAVRAGVRGILASCRDAGTLPDGADLDDLAEAVQICLNGCVLSRAVAPDDTLDALLERRLAGLLPGTARDAAREPVAPPA